MSSFDDCLFFFFGFWVRGFRIDLRIVLDCNTKIAFHAKTFLNMMSLVTQ